MPPYVPFMRALAIVAFCTTAANAQPAVTAGPQDAPPVAAASSPTLPQELDGRRNIRGCGVGETCQREADLLHESEAEAFPAPGRSPWIDERVTGSHLEATPHKKITRPSELRPDQAWLDKLEMPDLPVTWTPRLIEYLLFYKNDPRGRSIMASWLVAQGRYRDLI